MLIKPKPDTDFRLFNGRLALFHGSRTQDGYWAEHWANHDWGRLRGQDGYSALGELGRVCRRYVGLSDYVLEAGCGMGLIVAALQNEGHKVVGVERSQRVVDRVHLETGHLDVRSGDVEALDFPDQTFQTYISIGVVEHNPDGPCAALREARRVLVKGGHALISVPYLNPLRERHLAWLANHQTISSGFTFHQYYFPLGEFIDLLSTSGFRTIAVFPYATEAFLTREHPQFSRFWASKLRRERVKALFRRLFVNLPAQLGWRYAHMMMVVCLADSHP